MCLAVWLMQVILPDYGGAPMAGLNGKQSGTGLPLPAVAATELHITHLQPNPRHCRRGHSESDMAMLPDSMRGMDCSSRSAQWTRPRRGAHRLSFRVSVQLN